MKKINAFYWTATILFAGFMLFSGIPDMLMVPEAVAFLNHLGYPDYFVAFIGTVKVLGAIAILIPGFPRIKEWAYAGFAFDLIGATYSGIATDGFDVLMLMMLLPFGLLISSYVLFHRKMKQEALMA